MNPSVTVLPTAMRLATGAHLRHISPTHSTNARVNSIHDPLHLDDGALAVFVQVGSARDDPERHQSGQFHVVRIHVAIAIEIATVEGRSGNQLHGSKPLKRIRIPDMI